MSEFGFGGRRSPEEEALAFVLGKDLLVEVIGEEFYEQQFSLNYGTELHPSHRHQEVSVYFDSHAVSGHLKAAMPRVWSDVLNLVAAARQNFEMSQRLHHLEQRVHDLEAQLSQRRVPKSRADIVEQLAREFGPEVEAEAFDPRVWVEYRQQLHDENDD